MTLFSRVRVNTLVIRFYLAHKQWNVEEEDILTSIPYYILHLVED
jgi:hypothetical protein